MKETVQILHQLFKKQYRPEKMCPAFKALIGLGDEAINDIIDELETPTFLYRVIPEIIGYDILTPQESIHQINSCKAWILWGRKNQLIKYIRIFDDVFDETGRNRWIFKVQSAADVEELEQIKYDIDFYTDYFYDNY